MAKKKEEIEFIEEEVEVVSAVEPEKPKKAPASASFDLKGKKAHEKAAKIIQIMPAPAGLFENVVDEENGTTTSVEVVALGLQDDGSIVKVSLAELS